MIPYTSCTVYVERMYELFLPFLNKSDIIEYQKLSQFYTCHLQVLSIVNSLAGFMQEKRDGHSLVTPSAHRAL